MKRPPVISTHLMPKSRYAAITLFGVVFVRDRSRLTDTLINHEHIHCRQQRELLYLPFFNIYVLEWLCHLLRYRSWDRAYRAISFEREAYANDHNLRYLYHRPPYASFKHYFLMP